MSSSDLVGDYYKISRFLGEKIIFYCCYETADSEKKLLLSSFLKIND